MDASLYLLGLKFAVTVDPSDGLTSMLELAKFGERVKFGDDDDLQLYHDGSHSYENHNGTGNLLISGNNDVDISATTNVLMNGVTGVNVQFNGTTRFSSTNTGLGINGDIVDSSGGMTGTLTFPAIGGNIATEGFGIALAVALG